MGDGAAVVVVVVDDVDDEAGGPEDTTIATVEPFAALVPAVGLVLITLPVGTVAEDCCEVVTVNPA